MAKLFFNFRVIFVLGLVFFVPLFIYLNRKLPAPPITKEELALELTHQVIGGDLPQTLTLQRDLRGKKVLRNYKVNYTLDVEAQQVAESLLKTYNSDYAALVAVDANSGRILALASHYGSTASRRDLGHLALRAIFPSASVFKVITAAAALDQGAMTPETVIPFNGSAHTLYRRNVEKNDVNRWTRFMSLREAFGKSVNSVFGKIGLFYVGPKSLQDYADRFQFNRTVSSDIEFETGQTQYNPEDRWETVELASGFNDNTSLSALHGALIAAGIVAEGVIYEPGIVESLESIDPTTDPSSEDSLAYQFEPKVLSQVFEKAVAKDLRILMRETVVRGTSRKSFRQVFGRKAPEEIEFGGKTGSLNAKNPHGRTDWFVGYADSGNEKIAIAVMTLHEKLWRVKSSKLAGEFFRKGFGLGTAGVGLTNKNLGADKRAQFKKSNRGPGGR